MSVDNVSAADDVFREFVAEAEEMIERLEGDLGALLRGDRSSDGARRIARDIHTIKGSAQLFGLRDIARVAHAAEECLEFLRQSPDGLSPDMASLLRDAVDMIAKLLGVVKRTKAEPASQPETDAIVAKLKALATAGTARQTPEPPSTPKVSPLPPAEPLAQRGAPLDDGAADTIRVNVDLLDNLMNLAGELVLIRNQLEQVTRADANNELQKVSQRLNVVTGELQADVMKTRMQPIGTVLNKFQRVVRDLAKDLGKQVELELVGADTELDKTLIEAVRDPLMHLVRNAIDHGLERPEERRKAGKDEKGRLTLRSFHESGQVVIQINDDGRGLNRERIAKKAVERGLVTQDRLPRLPDRDVFQFIFLPGFSTAEAVSNLSGRGVGMDVVKTNIEGIGGSVELASSGGGGTTVTLKIPLTLAIISALIVRAGGDRYVVPQVKLVELLRVGGEGREHGMERLQGQLVYRLRGQLLPLIDLSSALASASATPLYADEMYNVVVVNADRTTFGVIVDAIEDSADVVVKPLANFIKDLGVYSGATILGDGSVVLTLDVNGLAKKAGLAIGLAAETAKDARAKSARDKDLAEQTEYLLVDVGAQGRYAIPLCLVQRLEEAEASAVQLSGARPVIPYRDAILPIVSIPVILGFRAEESPRAAGAKLPLVVVKKNGRSFGLLVDKIIDVVTTSANLDLKVSDREGLLGALIDGTGIIVIIDVMDIIDQQITAHHRDATEGDPGADAVREARGKHTLLLAEDSNFFRRQVVQILTGAGYAVQAMVDGERAFEALAAAAPGTFSAIISDIEMPVLDGFGLARRVRSTPEHGKLPLLAVSSRFSPDDVRRGREAGFDVYLEKLKQEEVVQHIDAALGIKGGYRAA